MAKAGQKLQFSAFLMKAVVTGRNVCYPRKGIYDDRREEPMGFYKLWKTALNTDNVTLKKRSKSINVLIS